MPKQPVRRRAGPVRQGRRPCAAPHTGGRHDAGDAKSGGCEAPCGESVCTSTSTSTTTSTSTSTSTATATATSTVATPTSATPAASVGPAGAPAAAPSRVPVDFKQLTPAFAHALYSALSGADDASDAGQGGRPESPGHQGHHGHHGVSNSAYGDLAQWLETLAQSLGCATTAPADPVAPPATVPVVPAAAPAGATTTTPATGAPADLSLLGAFKGRLAALATSASPSAAATDPASAKLAALLHLMAQSPRAAQQRAREQRAGIRQPDQRHCLTPQRPTSPGAAVSQVRRNHPVSRLRVPVASHFFRGVTAQGRVCRSVQSTVGQAAST